MKTDNRQAEAELLHVGLSPHIGLTKKQIREKLSPLLLAGDFFLTEDCYVVVGGKSKRRHGYFSITTLADVELLRMTFRDGLCIDQTLLVEERQLQRVYDALRRLDGYSKDKHRRFSNGSCVWRIGRVTLQHCEDETYHVKLRRICNVIKLYQRVKEGG